MSGERRELTPEAVDAVSLERALKDAEVANLRVIALTHELLTSETRVSELETALAVLKRSMDPRRKMEHVFRSNHTLYTLARRVKRVAGR